MAFPIKVCSICSEEFELKPGKPGFANRCPACSEPDDASSTDDRKAAHCSSRELNEARRKAMRDLLYRKDA
jgi:DNA-directed RNA polymerase subunit RPC12/RpoP